MSYPVSIRRYYDSVLTLSHRKTRVVFIWNGIRKKAFKTRFEDCHPKSASVVRVFSFLGRISLFSHLSIIWVCFQHQGQQKLPSVEPMPAIVIYLPVKEGWDFSFNSILWDFKLEDFILKIRCSHLLFISKPFSVTFSVC